MATSRLSFRTERINRDLDYFKSGDLRVAVFCGGETEFKAIDQKHSIRLLWFLQAKFVFSLSISARPFLRSDSRAARRSSVSVYHVWASGSGDGACAACAEFCLAT